MLNKLNDNDFPDIRSLYKIRMKHKNDFSISNLKMKVSKIENSHKRLNSDNNVLNDNNSIFFPLKKIKKNKIPLLLSPFSKNNSNKFLSDINLEYNNNTERSDKIYKRTIDIFFEKLIDRKKQNSSNKFLNYINTNFSSFLSTNNNNNNNFPYKINFNEFTINHSNKENFSSFTNNNNNIKTEQNFSPKIKNYNFNDVLMKLFRIVSIYNSKNNHLNDFECVNMMNDEIEKFYKDSNKEKMDDYRKNYMRKFTQEIKYLFSNTEISNKINKIEQYNNNHKNKLYLENFIFNKTELTNLFGEFYSKNLIRLKNKLFTEKVYQNYNINERFRNINKLNSERLKDKINNKKILFNNEQTFNLMKSNSNYNTFNTENSIYKYRNSLNSPININERSFIFNNFTDNNIINEKKINKDNNNNNEEIYHILNLKENNLFNVLNNSNIKIKNNNIKKINSKNDNNENILLLKKENIYNNIIIKNNKNNKNKISDVELNKNNKNPNCEENLNKNYIEKIEIEKENLNEYREKLNENKENLNEKKEKLNENKENLNEKKEKLKENNSKLNNEIINKINDSEKLIINMNKINNDKKNMKNLNIKNLKNKNINHDNIDNNNNNKIIKELKEEKNKKKNKKIIKSILNKNKINNQNINNDSINNRKNNNISNNKNLSSTGSWEEMSSYFENEENKNRKLEHHHKHKYNKRKHHHHKNHKQNTNENNTEFFSSKNSEYFEEEEKNENNLDKNNSISDKEIETHNINNNIQKNNSEINNSINSQTIKEKIKNDNINDNNKNNNNNKKLEEKKEKNISKFKKRNKYYDKSHLKNLFGLIKNAELLKQEKQENLLKKKSIHINQHPKKLESKNSFNQYENISLKNDKKIKKTRSKLFNLNILNESIEYDNNNIREEYSLLSPNSRRKKTQAMKLKLSEDINYYLSLKNWDEKDRLKLLDMKNKINNIKDFNMNELNLFLDFNDEIEDMKIAREMENRINKFYYNLNNTLLSNKNKREILESKIQWKDNIF